MTNQSLPIYPLSAINSDPNAAIQKPPPNHHHILLALLFIIIGIAIGIGTVYAYRYLKNSFTSSSINNYADCVNSPGARTQLSYPAVCVTSDGQRFIQPNTNESEDIIESPTTSWNQYSDSDTRFTFNYPQTWHISDTNIGGSHSDVEFDFENGKPMYLRVSANYNQLTGQPYSDLNEYLSSNLSLYDDITIDQTPAKYRSDSGGEHVIGFEEIIFITPDSQSIITLHFQPSYIDESFPSDTFDEIVSSIAIPDSNNNEGFACPDQKILDCTPCIGGPCPLLFPQHCSPGSAQYDWILKNCPDTEIIF